MNALKSLCSVALTYFYTATALAGPPFAESGPRHVELLELYSSESCSSCPPADAWASTLKNQPGLWKSFVPVVFHVDYWNDLGWVDGLSSNSMTKRQRDIAATWAQPSVYTPAVVADGQEWKNWHREIPQLQADNKIMLSLSRDESGAFQLKMKGHDPKRKYFLRMALLGMDLSSAIKGGENSGKTIVHNFVLLSWDGKPAQGKEILEAFSLTDAKHRTAKLAVAAWVEEAGNPKPLQAVGAYL